MTLFDVADTAVIITGASRGIGLAIARCFFQYGAKVALSAIDQSELEHAVDLLNAENSPRDDAIGVSGDISQPETGIALIDVAYQRFGRLDTIICNAGIDIIKPAVAYNVRDWDHVLSVNLRGAFLPAQAAAKRWIERSERGSIILTSSIAAKAGVTGLAPYSASKGGVEQLVRSLAVEWAEHGIRVNAVAPGYVDNIMSGADVHADPETEKRIRAFTPMRRRGRVEEIAAPFVFLASPAASYITGAVLAVDGGYTAQ